MNPTAGFDILEFLSEQDTLLPGFKSGEVVLEQVLRVDLQYALEREQLILHFSLLWIPLLSTESRCAQYTQCT